MVLKEAKRTGFKLLKYIQSSPELFEVLDISGEWALVTVKNHKGWQIVNTRNFNNGIASWCLGATNSFVGSDGKEHPGEDFYRNHTRRGDAHLLMVKISEPAEDEIEGLGADEVDPEPIDWNPTKGNWGVKYLFTYKPDGETVLWGQDNNLCWADYESLFGRGFNPETYKKKVIELEKSYNPDFGIEKDKDVLKGIKGQERLTASTRSFLKQILVEAGDSENKDLITLVENSDLAASIKLSILDDIEKNLF